METTNSYFKVLEYGKGEELKHIEKIGRVCYKSEDKISEDDSSAKKFVGMLMSRRHFAMVEHAALLFRVNRSFYEHLKLLEELLGNLHGRHYYINHTAAEEFGNYIVSANLRGWFELIEDCINTYGSIELPKCMIEELKRLDVVFGSLLNNINTFTTGRGCKCISEDDLTEEEKDMHQYTSVWIRCDRGVSHELVRHRPVSFAQESTRYCNYSKEKFGRSVQFLDIMDGMKLDKVMKEYPQSKLDVIYEEWLAALQDAEEHYMVMIDLGATPQIARSVLPNSTKTEITLTANRHEWEIFFSLRDDAAAHPQMREIAEPLHKEMQKLNRVK